MIKSSEVARHVRVKLNDTFEIKSLSDRYLVCEPILYISEGHIYNDGHKGAFVFIRGGSHTNSGTAYLSELDLEFPITDRPMYSTESVDYSVDISRFKNHLEDLKS